MESHTSSPRPSQRGPAGGTAGQTRRLPHTIGVQYGVGTGGEAEITAGSAGKEAALLFLLSTGVLPPPVVCPA